MELKTKNYPIENKILLLLGMEGLDKNKVRFSRIDKERKQMFSYDLWCPIRKETLDYIKLHCKLKIKEVAWISKVGWQCYYTFSL